MATIYQNRNRIDLVLFVFISCACGYLFGVSIVCNIIVENGESSTILISNILTFMRCSAIFLVQLASCVRIIINLEHEYFIFKPRPIQSMRVIRTFDNRTNANVCRTLRVGQTIFFCHSIFLHFSVPGREWDCFYYSV